jgi:hypothetical protein
MSLWHTFEQRYATEPAKDRFARVEGLFVSSLDRIRLSHAEFLCVCDATNGFLWNDLHSLQPGMIEMEVEDFAQYRAEEFHRWGAKLGDLLEKIRPLNEVQRLGLLYCASVWFDLSSEQKNAFGDRLEKLLAVA